MSAATEPQNQKQKAPTAHSFLGFPDHLETLKAAVRIISTVHHANPERNRTKDILETSSHGISIQFEGKMTIT
jgi:hypothetical protein